ncbi:hypothetical protein FX988_02944 [Paraglaciecola mesophila]|uniref:Uncharacterized protein n=1 Tax=Paraglaciecola mesophila TaxID=197222 RepID=A0A857JME9_9ALTE|nr:hypothetical protein [Paraglaciecola mesophila]QHJ12686.1 hypothetical protein FX988_02944 [Paraglaciecola mesophila]
MAENLPSGLALVLCLFATAVFYIGCPNQQWFAKRYLTFLPSLLISLVLSLLAWWLLLNVMSGLSGVFTVLSLEMLFLGLIPFMPKYEKPLANTSKAKSSLVRGDSYANHQTQWLLKTIGMFLIGFPFAVFTSSLIGWMAPDSVPSDIRSQYIMWLIVPLWLTPLSLIFFSRRPLSVFIAFVTLTCVAFGLLQIIKFGG